MSCCASNAKLVVLHIYSTETGALTGTGTSAGRRYMFGALIEKLMPGQEIEDSDDSDETEIFRSLEKSRKRHLSPGLLRGDRVADCLRVQEASASPCLKKPRSKADSDSDPDPESDMALTLADFREYMRTNTDKNIASLEGRVSDLHSSIDRVDKSVQLNTKKIDFHTELIQGNSKAISDMKRELDALKTQPPIPTLPLNPRPHEQTAVTAPRLESEDIGATQEYYMARRSLRIWPIRGISNRELWLATGNFIKDDLGHLNLTEHWIESISRPNFQSGPSAVDEVVVRFKTADLRDAVMGSSSRLTTKIDDQGKPTAGLRIEITAALRPAMKILERYGQQLRARHGPGTRRHFKFDDIDRSLYLNIKLPGDTRWSKVTLDMARRGVSVRERFTSEELERRIDINGPPANERPRPASTSSSGQDNSGPWRTNNRPGGQ